MLGVKPNGVIDDDVSVYYYNGSTYEVVTVKNTPSLNIVIPAKVNGISVSRINKYAATYLYNGIEDENGNEYAKTIKISSGIEKISTNAFYCMNDHIINIPQSVSIINYRGFYDCDSIIIDNDKIPEDWDSEWQYSSEYVLEKDTIYYSTADYFYKIKNNTLYLVKYRKTINTSTPIIIPSKIEDKTVYGICSKCFYASSSSNSSSSYSFVIPSTIKVMESNAIYISGYGYSNLFMSFTSATSIPTTWNTNWFYSSYNGNFNSGYNNVYYSSSWSYVNGIPTPLNY